MSSETGTNGQGTDATADSAVSDDEGSTAASKTIATLVFLGLAIFYLINAFLLPNAETEEGIGPKTFPVAVAIVLVCTTVMGLFSLLRGRVAAKPVTGTELVRVVICIVLFALFAASIFLIGFAEAAAIFSVLTTILVFGVRLRPLKAVWVLVIGLVIGMILFLVFDVWLNVLLPVGWIEFLVFGGLNL
ncbi:tripartite tricarboxylate transporter TctB family protein [Brevibacterium sp.]|jgi:putative tricarboxylic transport membrane protein|uniref:tripartite tricarboxylate transporter TctB family protein n=1 Tax=Brevibacterium sp. TaxID=1701 RepID=UPI002620353D|nr:tripartite tricarboxylate transporter TctB family protein [Brevibacterium sp.]